MKEKIVQPTFPDQEYLHYLAQHLREKVAAHQTVSEGIQMYSGAALNWIGDFLTDSSVEWSKTELPIDQLVLTGTNPAWNKIILEQCQRSPQLLRQAIASDPKVAAMFADTVSTDVPILVRVDENKHKVLDGMHRTIAAIRDGRQTISAYVGRLQGKPQPQCEPHVIADLIRAYDRKINVDREGLIAALRFLKESYVNVEPLLRERFSGDWMPNAEIREIVTEVLKE